MPKLDLYKLGELGVDLTNSVIHSEDGTFTQAQNAVPNRRGEAGALTKRDGLVAINSSAMSTPARGVVYAGIPGLTPAGGGGAGSGTLRVYKALQQDSNSRGYGWSHSSDSWATAGTTVTTNPAPTSEDQYTLITHRGANAVATVNNKIYYSDDHLTSAANATPPTIRVFDGVIDRELVRVPINPDTYDDAFTEAIWNFLAVGPIIYMTVFDFGSTSANQEGSVLSLDTRTGVLQRVGGTFAAGRLPYSLAWHMGRLWCGTGTFTGMTSTAKVFFIRPGIDTAWTEDEEFAAGLEIVTAMTQYKGKLYAAFGTSSQTSTPLIRVRTPGTGAWATSDTGDAGTANMYYGMTVFKDNLYCLYRNQTPAASRVRKFDDTSWSTVTSDATGRMIQIFSTADNIYVFNRVDETVIVSSDGSSWSGARTVTSDGALSILNGVAAISI